MNSLHVHTAHVIYYGRGIQANFTSQTQPPKHWSLSVSKQSALGLVSLYKTSIQAWFVQQAPSHCCTPKLTAVSKAILTLERVPCGFSSLISPKMLFINNLVFRVWKLSRVRNNFANNWRFPKFVKLKTYKTFSTIWYDAKWRSGNLNVLFTRRGEW